MPKNCKTYEESVKNTFRNVFQANLESVTAKNFLLASLAVHVSALLRLCFTFFAILKILWLGKRGNTPKNLADEPLKR